MLDISIYSIGKNTSKEMQILEGEYIKRIRWEITCISFESSKNAGSDLQQKSNESNLILAKLKKNSLIIALDDKGDSINSERFAAIIQNFALLQRKKIAFCIGGANGHSEDLIARADMVLSLSKMTFPHKLVRLILLEQLYRAYSIINNHPYHRGE